MTEIHTYIHTYIHTGYVRGVMDIDLENRHSDTSSNPGL